MYQQQLKNLSELAIQCAGAKGEAQRQQSKQTAAEIISYQPVYAAWLDLVEHLEANPKVTVPQAVRRFRALLAERT